jgi:hypothetical protein
MRRDKGLWVVYAVLLVAMSGCAFGTRTVALNPVQTALALDGAGQRVYVEVLDKREAALKPVVGHVKNGFGMKTADVVGDREVTVWVRDSLLAELRRFGVQTISDPAALDGGASKLAVDVQVCYAQAYWNYGGEVRVALTVSQGQKALVDGKMYSGTAQLGTNFGATAESYQRVLELAMDALLQQMLPDIITAITANRPPKTSGPGEPGAGNG